MGINDKQMGKDRSSKSVCLSHLHKEEVCLLLLNYSSNLVLELLVGKCLLKFWARQLNNWLEKHEQGVDFSWRQQHLWCAAITPSCHLPTCGNCVMGLPHQLHLFCSLKSCNRGGKKGLGLKGDTPP